LQVRIKGILQNILNACTTNDFPLPLAKFFTHYCENGSYVPDGTLTSFEMSRLNIDTYGSVYSQTPDKEQMMVAFFLITKVLVAQVLLQADLYAGLRTEGNDNIKRNLKVIASTIQSLLLDYFSSRLSITNNSNFYSFDLFLGEDSRNDGLREVLFSIAEVSPFF
jgi:hypothetical protein